ncbi:hypothetical protein BBBOND_0210830 [Babesia bigemina]|uniref:Uncharacterized protein n=1 Tax=Babesia bigemina TaxID=5866 RepID=A0A061D5U8_BABBI|nr:hypothetical protein BBBOND_0210830 [Babesia bigemina]CDR95933.1 hypothetical protein BBBOND_0210830 [Babesia bigemina]|eukprot:XP_012768119.1 hypothetical protein BBBOND_0210830 [Babesia bigemina]
MKLKPHYLSRRYNFYKSFSDLANCTTMANYRFTNRYATTIRKLYAKLLAEWYSNLCFLPDMLSISSH